MNKLNGKMPCAWETKADLRDRLQGCIVLYKGQPMRVLDSLNKCTLTLGPLPVVDNGPDTPEYTTVKTTDPDLDVSSVELGYINTYVDNPVENDCLYLARLPSRTYKQGIHPYNTFVASSVRYTHEHQHVESILKSKGFVESLTGEFPCVDSVDEYFNRGGWCLAMSQELMFKKGPSGVVRLFFRGLEIAWRGPGTRSVFLKDNGMVWAVRKLIEGYNIKVIVQ